MQTSSILTLLPDVHILAIYLYSFFPKRNIYKQKSFIQPKKDLKEGICIIGNNKAQTWSVDILMAVFVFLVILVLFFGILASMSTPEKGQRLSKDAELISKALTGRSDQSVLDDNKVNVEKLKGLDYNALKQQLGIRGDFCIYFEDSKGNLIPVQVSEDPATGEPIFKNGIGADGVLINDINCGEEYQR